MRQSYCVLQDAAQFERLVREHQQMVFRTLARLVDRTDRLDDLAQDVFLRLYKAIPAFRGEAMVSTYLYRITVNVAQDEWKRLRREDRRNDSLSDEGMAWEQRLSVQGESAEEALLYAELQQNVQTQMMQLNQVERTVLVLYHQEERSYQEIAEVLRLPIGTVRTHLHRARKKLREGLGLEEAR